MMLVLLILSVVDVIGCVGDDDVVGGDVVVQFDAHVVVMVLEYSTKTRSRSLYYPKYF